MKLKNYMLPLALAISANGLYAEDYSWALNTGSGSYPDPNSACASKGGFALYPVRGYPAGWYGCYGVCSITTTSGGNCLVRGGDSCPEGSTYVEVLGQCLKADPPPCDPGVKCEQKKDECEKGTMDSTGQCGPKADPSDPCKDPKTGNPIIIGTGQKVELDTDISIANSALNFTRNYWSSRQNVNSMGLAWQHNWRMHIYKLSDNNKVKLYRNDGRGFIFTPLANGQWQPPVGIKIQLTTLANNAGWKVFSAEDNTIEIYNAKGQLISYEAIGLPVVNLAYNSIGQLTQLKDTNSNTMSINYSTEGLITKVTTSTGVTVSYSYDSQKRLITRNLYGKTKIYHYENSQFPNALTGVTDERGVRYVTWTYNDKGQAISSENSGGVNKYTLEFIDANHTKVTNPLGRSAIYTFENLLEDRKVKNIDGQPIGSCVATSKYYNHDYTGKLLNKSDVNNNSTSYEYNDRGLVVKETSDSNGTKQIIWHDTLPLPLKINNEGRITTYRYDTEGRLLKVSYGNESEEKQDTALLQFADFTDQVGNKWVSYNNPQIIKDRDAIAQNALYLDGKAYLKTNSTQITNLGNSEFTIEFWLKPDQSLKGRTSYLLSSPLTTANNNFFALGINSGQLPFIHILDPDNKIEGVSFFTNGYTIFDGNWHHMAVVRNAEGEIHWFLDGKQNTSPNIGNADWTKYDITSKQGTIIGGRYDAMDTYNYMGKLDQLRVSKRVIYTDSFRVGNKPYSLNNDTQEHVATPDRLLLQFNDYTDPAGNNWQPVGNPQIVKDSGAIAGSALALDGKSYLETDNTQILNVGTGEFTIEFWINPKDQGSARTSQTVISTKLVESATDTSNSVRIGFDGNMPVLGHYINNEYTASGMNLTNTDVPINTWSHVAVTRNSEGRIQWYLNGKKRVCVNTCKFNGVNFTSAIATYIGIDASDMAEFRKFNGLLDQIKVTKNVIYTDEFTPSREPYVYNDGSKN